MDIMGTIAELGSEKVMLRGQELTVRPLRAVQSGKLEEQFPRPRVKGPTPEAEAAEERSPEFKALLRRYHEVRRCGIVAIAAGITLGDEPWTPQRDRAWLEKLTDRMLETFTEEELMALYVTSARLASPFRDADKAIGTGSAAGN